jgi:DNA-binding XRE family transcriptional regulator
VELVVFSLVASFTPLEHALGKIILPSQTSALAAEKKEFHQLIAELKRLSSKDGYSQEQIASEVGVSPITVNQWWTGHSLTGPAREY